MVTVANMEAKRFLVFETNKTKVINNIDVYKYNGKTRKCRDY